MPTSRPKILIAGSGSAGLFCAWALADHADVLVVEAGPDPGDPVPRQIVYDTMVGQYDWGYKDADTDQALLAGRVVGGTSTVNTAGFLRGEPADYDAWGPGWTWADCLQAFCALESDLDFGAEPYHGADGPIPVSRAAPSPFDTVLTEVCVEAGHTRIPDHNAPGVCGVAPWPTNTRAGARIGTLAGLMPGLRTRVGLRAGTDVEAVVVERGRALGLRVRTGQATEVLCADHVVLAAGTYGSPLLLYRSGLELPGLGVGMQNHSEAWFLVRCVRADWPAQMASLGTLLRANLEGEPRGMMSAYFMPCSTLLASADSASLLPGAGPDDLLVQVVLLGPRGCGDITWHEGTPEIRNRHFGDPEDVSRLSRMIGHVAGLVDRLVERGVVQAAPDAWWRGPDRHERLKEVPQYAYHATGTCGIGRVVDERLRVRGIEGLSIADASVMPAVPQANTNLPAMMVGLRAGQLLAEELCGTTAL